MAWAIAFAISVCERRGLKLPTAGASGPPALNRRSISASNLPTGRALWSAASGLSPGAWMESVKMAFQWCEDGSGRNIRHQLHFQQGDVVFQLQFALLQPAQLQLIVMAVQDQHVYDRIEVAMFHVEFNQPPLDILVISHDFLLFPTDYYKYF
jgi:hypothetical protein